MLWRRSYDTPPPPLAADNPYDVAGDPRYEDMDPDDVPAHRVPGRRRRPRRALLGATIVPDLRATAEWGGAVLVAAHGNSIRALRKHLEGIADDAITELEIPTGIPFRMRLDDDLTVRSADLPGRPRGRRGRGRRRGPPGRPLPGLIGHGPVPPTCPARPVGTTFGATVTGDP